MKSASIYRCRKELHERDLDHAQSLQPKAKDLSLRHRFPRVCFQTRAHSCENGVYRSSLVVNNGGQAAVRGRDDVMLLVELNQIFVRLVYIWMILDLCDITTPTSAHLHHIHANTNSPR